MKENKKKYSNSFKQLINHKEDSKILNYSYSKLLQFIDKVKQTH